MIADAANRNRVSGQEQRKERNREREKPKIFGKKVCCKRTAHRIIFIITFFVVQHFIYVLLIYNVFGVWCGVEKYVRLLSSRIQVLNSHTQRTFGQLFAMMCTYLSQYHAIHLFNCGTAQNGGRGQKGYICAVAIVSFGLSFQCSYFIQYA